MGIVSGALKAQAIQTLEDAANKGQLSTDAAAILLLVDALDAEFVSAPVFSAPYPTDEEALDFSETIPDTVESVETIEVGDKITAESFHPAGDALPGEQFDAKVTRAGKSR